MKDYETKNIKNVVVLGHTGSGKTEVLESILFNNKITDRFGKSVDGNSIIDSDSEEVKRGMSVYSFAASFLLSSAGAGLGLRTGKLTAWIAPMGHSATHFLQSLHLV